MISKKDLKSYNFSDLTEYFDYILESQVNGQFEQVEELILELSKPQRVDLMSYLVENYEKEKAKSVYKKCSKIIKW